MTRRRSPIVLLSVLLVVSILGWIGFDYLVDRLRAPKCGEPTTVTVAAAPGIAQALTDAAKKADTADCYRVEVHARDSGETLTLLSQEGATDRPDVWVPESTMWLRRARDEGAWKVPESGTSVANSPVVLASKQAGAWNDLVGPGSGLKVGMADPAVDPASLATLVGVRDLTGKSPTPDSTLVATLRPISANATEQASALYGGNLDAFPTSEQDLLLHNAKPDVPRLEAVYPDPPVPGLDFPYVVLPDAGEAQRTGAERFLAVARASATELQASKLRSPDGAGSPAVPPTTLPDRDAVADALNVWAGLTLSARLLAVLDVSGSMSEIVPGTGQTRMKLAIGAAERGLGMFKPTTEVGLWKFSTALDGDRDYQEVLPVEPIAQHLAAGALAKLEALRPQGATGLYDTTLAAYTEARAAWKPGRINIVVIMTDGRNEDPKSITQPQLLEELAKLQDKRRPLPIITIGMGPDVDVDELQRIATATGGYSFTTADPAGISDIFVSALAKMLCQPPACRPS
jgi:ABC-type molybdate transport system substrate-binding protein